MDSPLGGIHLFFFLYAFGQVVVEVGAFLIVSLLLKRFAPSWVYPLFSYGLFIALLAHATDFAMVRIMDTSIQYVFTFFLGSGFKNFLVAFQALNLNLFMLGMILVAMLGLPLVGVLVYALTQKLSNLKPLDLSPSLLILFTLAIGLFLFSLDLVIRPHLNQEIYVSYSKRLPLPSPLLAPAKRGPIKKPLKQLRAEPELPPIHANKLPNIYLFVVESFRKDAISATVTPHLASFEKKHISFEQSFANSDATASSWFALYHAALPTRWTEVRDRWELGAVPLRMLKELGYQIRVYSSADLSYFQMDRVLFGKNRKLADHVEEFCSLDLLPLERDQLLFKRLQEDLVPSGTAYLLFLDGTHSEYTLPSGVEPTFTPAAASLDYFSLIRDPSNLEPILNRYKNAVHFEDALFGSFFKTLKERSLYDSSLIAITGDHGEEFFEEGALFHGTHLNYWQTAVPILLKIGQESASKELATHIDLFPTLLHHLTGEEFPSLFEGSSLYGPSKKVHIAVQHKGPLPPEEIALFSDNQKLSLTLPHLEILSGSPTSPLLEAVETAL